jgi:hypothetical protein
LERSIAVPSPVLTIWEGGATQEDVNWPMRPYQRMGKSVSERPSLPISDDVVMYDGGGGGFAFCGERRTFTAGSAFSVKRYGMGVRFKKEVSCPEG